MDKYNAIAVGNRIRRIRQYLGWSMEKFASEIDDKAKSGTVSNWETGKNLPNNERLKRIAELANITVEYLLSGNPIDNMSTEEYDKYVDTQQEHQRIQPYIEKFKNLRYPEIDGSLTFSKRHFSICKHILTSEELTVLQKLFEGKEKNYPTDEEIEKEYYQLREQYLQYQKKVSEGKFFIDTSEFHDYDFH